jgi:hypothetical protein
MMHLREISNSKELKDYEGALSAPLELISSTAANLVAAFTIASAYDLWT